MRYPVLFKICLILLLFGIASVKALKDTKDCETVLEDGTCVKSTTNIPELEDEDSETTESFFSPTHDCDLNDISGEGSCERKDPPEEEDQSELSMYSEQINKKNNAEYCSTSDQDNCDEIVRLDEETSVNVDESSEVGDLKSLEESGDNEIRVWPEDQMDSPKEGDQSQVVKDVPLREILLKLKPDSLTDNDDDQPSVTEVPFGEEEEVEEEIPVSSGSADKQESGLDGNGDQSKNGSGTSSSGTNKKAICTELEMAVITSDVEIINATLLMKLLQGNPNVTNRSSAAPCHLIYFFSPYCPFSAAGSPYVNAMARSLKNIPVFGLDSIEYHSVNARYGVMGTPTLLLFHNGNGVGRYNATDYSVSHLLSFINHYTDQVITDINVTSADFRATLPSQVVEGQPYALWASWIFLLSCAAWLFLTSDLCDRLTEAILNNWREAEAQNDQD